MNIHLQKILKIIMRNEINEKQKDIKDQFIENISDILKKILFRFKEVDSLLPKGNEKLN